MSLPQIYTDPNSFGKDDYVPFMGQVEDVDDPKRSGRVKVRCLGLHPRAKEDGEGLATEDLPWARVAMPVTHAQQQRIGGKHGLIPGSIVIGFFLDGMDQQDPMVTHSVGHTAKASDKNNRKKVDVGEGTLPSDIEGITKVSVRDKNAGIATKREMTTGRDDPGDVAKDTAALDDSTNGGPCAIDPSAFSETKLEPLKPGNPHSQLFNVPVADGQCGALMNGRAIIADEINKLMPDGVGRVVEGDDLFDINGNIINVNALINRLSTLIAGQLKYTINTNKAFIQKTINKVAHSTGIFAGASRSPMTAQLVDLSLSTKFDIFNSAIDIFISSLEGVVKEGIRSVYQQKLDSKFADNLTGEAGALGASILMDVSPIEIADSVITDVEIAYDLTCAACNKSLDKRAGGISSKVEAFDSKASNAKEEDYEGADSMNEDIDKDYKEIEDDIKKVGDQSKDILEEVNDTLGNVLKIPKSLGISLSDVSQFLMLVLEMDFTTNLLVFNRVGPMVLDIFTQSGCCPFDMFNTHGGYVGSLAGIGGKFDGGGSESGKSSKRDKDIYANSGFAGKPGETSIEDSTNANLESDTTVVKMGESVRDRIRERSPSFTPVDYYEQGRSYTLSGECSFGGVMTNRSRVLVNNQEDPTENGIYITSKGDWKRTEDADSPKNFNRKKKVRVKSMGNKEGLFYYSGKEKAKVGYDEIEFLNLFESDEFTQKEKNAFDNTVQIIPDGKNATFFLASRPSSDEDAARNYVEGIPNVAIIDKPGKNYHFTSRKPGRNFPSIAIQGYTGTPRPVVDPDSGELVMVLVNYNSFDERRSNPSGSVFPDDSSKGISTADPNYDVYLSGFYISNTGVGYSKETTIKVIDKDKKVEAAEVRPRIRKGRITKIEVINKGEGFKRIPRIKIENAGSGEGLKIYPMMGLRPIKDSPEVKKLQQNVALNLPTRT